MGKNIAELVVKMKSETSLSVETMGDSTDQVFMAAIAVAHTVADASKFDVWCAYCITVAQSVVTACGEDTDEDRVYLMGYGLAARTFNFAAHPVRRGECDPAPFIKAAQYECKDDVEFFSMWHLLVVLIELLRVSETEDMHDMVSAMVKMNRVRVRYRQAADKLPKRDAQ